MEEASGIVDEVGDDAPTQIEFAKILVGHDQIAGPRRVASQGTMDVENT